MKVPVAARPRADRPVEATRLAPAPSVAGSTPTSSLVRVDVRELRLVGLGPLDPSQVRAGWAETWRRHGDRVAASLDGGADWRQTPALELELSAAASAWTVGERLALRVIEGLVAGPDGLPSHARGGIR